MGGWRAYGGAGASLQHLLEKADTSIDHCRDCALSPLQGTLGSPALWLPPPGMSLAAALAACPLTQDRFSQTQRSPSCSIRGPARALRGRKSNYQHPKKTTNWSPTNQLPLSGSPKLKPVFLANGPELSLCCFVF